MKTYSFNAVSLASKLTVNATLALGVLVAPAIAFAGKLHVYTSDAAGFNTHSIWYDDGKEVTVVDTQFTPQIGQALVSDIRKQTRSPITRIIVTHPNPDKFNALSVFHKLGAKSYASIATAAAIPDADAYKRYFWVNIAKAFTDETYPKVEPVQITFAGKHVIKLQSGETISLLELKNPGVSSNQVVVRIDKTGDLIVGDLVHTQNHAWLEGGIVNGKAKPTFSSWKAALQELPAFSAGKPKAKVFGGRGTFELVKKAVTEQIDYLTKAERIVDSYIASLGDKKAELGEPTLQGAHYVAIQAELAKAFPDYAMADLVGYSVYGLVQQKLAAQ